MTAKHTGVVAERELDEKDGKITASHLVAAMEAGILGEPEVTSCQRVAATTLPSEGPHQLWPPMLAAHLQLPQGSGGAASTGLKEQLAFFLLPLKIESCFIQINILCKI